MGAGQIARGERVGGGRSSQPRRKEKALYFLFILPGRKRKLPKPRPQYFIGQTQGTWFELTARERPSPLRHTLNASPTVFSQEAQPPSTPPVWGTHLQQPEDPLTVRGSSCRRHHRQEGRFVPPAGGAPGMGRSQRPGSRLQRPEQAVKSLTDRYLPAPEQASSTVLGEQPARARGAPA